MSEVYEFIRKCGVFWILTINDGFPVGRPFGAIMERNNNLFISTKNTKSVYNQLKTNSHMQIVAIQNGTRNWIRVKGTAEECMDALLKEKMFEECPLLKNHFSTSKDSYFSLFKIKIIESYINIS